ncbi:hypothetical protein [Cuneatibacter caecimuris]|uniref:Uncharacterized protein n=1 Tax=Cuneatibacter caecimuris TaxID=1796618 RepID=A0A4Q7PNX0_9FIRM|nr:hypothetical protein [Cuneatibacter caecimuris]RZT02662.1 hypothetical protein EV209_0784 [Cuneatibacter caecimuris]
MRKTPYLAAAFLLAAGLIWSRPRAVFAGGEIELDEIYQRWSDGYSMEEARLRDTSEADRSTLLYLGSEISNIVLDGREVQGNRFALKSGQHVSFDLEINGLINSTMLGAIDRNQCRLDWERYQEALFLGERGIYLIRPVSEVFRIEDMYFEDRLADGKIQYSFEGIYEAVLADPEADGTSFLKDYGKISAAAEVMSLRIVTRGAGGIHPEPVYFNRYGGGSESLGVKFAIDEEAEWSAELNGREIPVEVHNRDTYFLSLADMEDSEEPVSGNICQLPILVLDDAVFGPGSEADPGEGGPNSGTPFSETHKSVVGRGVSGILPAIACTGVSLAMAGAASLVQSRTGKKKERKKTEAEIIVNHGRELPVLLAGGRQAVRVPVMLSGGSAAEYRWNVRWVSDSGSGDFHAVIAGAGSLAELVMGLSGADLQDYEVVLRITAVPEQAGQEASAEAVCSVFVYREGLTVTREDTRKGSWKARLVKPGEKPGTAEIQELQPGKFQILRDRDGKKWACVQEDGKRWTVDLEEETADED